jgi:hypothetical protein
MLLIEVVEVEACFVYPGFKWSVEMAELMHNGIDLIHFLAVV